jgi:hypothetical protein
MGFQEIQIFVNNFCKRIISSLSAKIRPLKLFQKPNRHCTVMDVLKDVNCVEIAASIPGTGRVCPHFTQHSGNHVFALCLLLPGL